MRLKLLLFLLLGILLNSCYKFDSLPKKYISSYEFMIPLIDTTINVVGFEDIKGRPDSYEIPKDVPINMGEISCLFYLNKLGELDVIEWLAPRMIMESGGISGAKINLQIYTYTGGGEKNYFWLEEGYTFTVNSNKTVIPEIPKNVIPDNLLRDTDKVYINATISFPENISVARLISEKIKMKIGIKVKMKNNLEINL